MKDLEEGKQYDPKMIHNKFGIELADFSFLPVISRGSTIFLTERGAKEPRYLARIPDPQHEGPRQRTGPRPASQEPPKVQIVRDMALLQHEIKVGYFLPEKFLDEQMNISISALLSDTRDRGWDGEKKASNESEEEPKFRMAKLEPAFVRGMEKLYAGNFRQNPDWLMPVYFIGQATKQNEVKIVEVRSIKQIQHPDPEEIGVTVKKYLDMMQAHWLGKQNVFHDALQFQKMLRTILDILDSPDGICRGLVRSMYQDPMIQYVVNGMKSQRRKAAELRSRFQAEMLKEAIWPDDYAEQMKHIHDLPRRIRPPQDHPPERATYEERATYREEPTYVRQDARYNITDEDRAYAQHIFDAAHEVPTAADPQIEERRLQELQRLDSTVDPTPPIHPAHPRDSDSDF